MTTDEILTLPASRLLDALVAEKVMDWYVSPSGLCDSSRRAGQRFPIGDTCEIIPTFSAHLPSTWQAVDRLRRNGLTFALIGKPGLWFASFYRPSVPDRVHAADGETASLAVCRAALLTVTGDDHAPG